MKVATEKQVNLEKLVLDFSYFPGSIHFSHHEVCTEVSGGVELRGNLLPKVKEIAKELLSAGCETEEEENEIHIWCDQILPYGRLEYGVFADFYSKVTYVGKRIEFCAKPKK